MAENEKEELPEGMGKRGALRAYRGRNLRSIGIHAAISAAVTDHPLVRSGVSKKFFMQVLLVQALREDVDVFSAEWLGMVRDHEEWMQDHGWRLVEGAWMPEDADV